MDLQPVKTTYDYGESDWLASRDGTEFTETVTLDLTKFTAADHFPDGYIRAGSPVVLNGTSHLYEPVAADATSSDGHVFMNVKVNAGATKAGAPLLVRGRVKLSGVPYESQAAAPDVRYV